MAGMRSITLSAWEHANSQLPPTVTATLYECGSVGVGGVESFLQKRVAAILQKNPWLASHIVKQKQQLAMSFPEALSADEAKEYAKKKVVSIVDSDTLPKLHSSADPSNIPYGEFVDALRPFLHSSTDAVVGQPDVSLWKVLLVPCSKEQENDNNNEPPTHCWLVHALNHSLGDGNTFYQVYGMLSHDAPDIQALDPTRVANLEDLKQQVLDTDPSYLRSGSMIAGILYRLFLAVCGLAAQVSQNGQSSTTQFWKVDMAKVAKIKEQHKQSRAKQENKGTSQEASKDLPFISTNDILTSWFFSLNRDKPTVGTMVVDMRNRAPANLSGTLAGNYEAELLFNSGDAASAAHVRASLTRVDGVWKRITNSTLPSSWQRLRGHVGGSVVTNWATFHLDVVLCNDENELFRPLFHWPVFLQHNGAVAMVQWHIGVIFRPSATELGLLAIVPPNAVQESPNAPLIRPQWIYQ